MKNIFTIFSLCLFTTCAFAQKGWAQPVTDTKIVRFFPNPATNFITFDIQRPIERGFVIQITNFLGRRVLTFPVNSNKFTIQLADLFAGIYIFQLRDKNGSIIESNKFQVSK